MPVVRISERVGFLPGAVNIGVLTGDSGHRAMIDTGLNDTSARKALKAIAEGGGSVTTILTTHAHADHFGGNATVVKRTGAKVWAPPVDEAILSNPLLQPSLLFAGADPPPSMRGGFLLADASPVDRVIDESTIDFDGIPIDVISLHGHSPGQVGFVVDGTFFSADVVLPASVLEKYRIPYLYSITDHLKSLELATDVACTHVVPGHGEPSGSIAPSAETNRALIDQVANCILEVAREPSTAETLFLKILERFDAPIANPGAYFLLHPTIFAFLSYLESTGALASEIDGKRLLWRTS
jgi:glyoxylase-like metal-dependent hydrolase (beta-lactamase superfamily II)